jgi:hypothetical protein
MSFAISIDFSANIVHFFEISKQLGTFSAKKDRYMLLSPEDNWVEDGGNEQGNGQGLVPMIADGALDVEDMFEYEVNEADDGGMEPDNH